MARKDSLEVLERIVRNLPIAGRITWRFHDTDEGRVRFAYGRASDGTFHGVWAVDDSAGNPKLCRPLEFAKGSHADGVARELLMDALGTLTSMARKGMNKTEWWDAKRNSHA